LSPGRRRDISPTSIADEASKRRISVLPEHIDESANGCLAGEIEQQDRHVTPSVTHPLSGLFAFDNGVVERLIGSIRRECVDHIMVLGEDHLRRILRSYARYYNGIRTHWSLDKDAPVSRPLQRTGSTKSNAILGGRHHHYIRV
jgi:hypothetical protein